MGAAEAMGEWEGNSDIPMKHNETKHDDMKSKTNEAKLTNIWVAQQAQIHRMDSMTKNKTLLA